MEVSKEDAIYGWSFRIDQGASSDFYNTDIPQTAEPQKRSVILNTPTKSLDDVWEVIYKVPLEFCRKCNAVKVLNDWNLNQAGRVDIVINEEKLSQDLQKLLLTIRNTHVEHAWYGTSLSNLVASKFISGIEIRTAAEIQEALERYVKLQMKQSNFQTLSPRERIRSLEGLNAERGTGPNLDTLFFEITIATDARTLSTTAFGISTN